MNSNIQSTSKDKQTCKYSGGKKEYRVIGKTNTAFYMRNSHQWYSIPQRKWKRDAYKRNGKEIQAEGYKNPFT